MCKLQWTYLLTYSSWEANQFSASQEIPHISWKPKVHYRIHKCLPPVPILEPARSSSLWTVHNRIHFYSEELLAPHPTPKLKYHPLLAICDCLFNIFTATLHIRGRSSIYNLRTHHAVVTGSHLSQKLQWVVCKNIVRVTLPQNKVPDKWTPTVTE